MHIITKVLFIFVMVFGVQNVVIARPNRVKRVSDSHLADLETRLGLNNRDNKVVVTLPISSLSRNAMEIGRKRRSQSRFLDVLFNESEEENGDPMPPEYEDLNDNYGLKLRRYQ